MTHPPGDGGKDTGEAGDAPLHEALDDLEHMLGPGSVPAPGTSTPPTARATHDASRDPDAAGISSPPPAKREAPPRPGEPDEASGIDTWDPGLYRMAAERLASEVEIIMNTRLQATLADLGEDLRRDIRNHIEIVLPEIVATLADADGDIPPRHE